MKILQINNCHYRRGGADVVYLNTGELLEKRGHEVYYFSQKSIHNLKCSTEKYFINSVDFFNESLWSRMKLVFRFFYSFEAAAKIEKLILEKKPDIAHLHIYKGTLTPSILRVLKKHGVPVVQTLHDYGLICPHNSFLDGEGNICTRCYDSGNPLNCVIHKCNRNNYLLSLFSFLEYEFNSIIFPFNQYINGFISVCDFSYNLHKSKEIYKSKLQRLYNFNPNDHQKTDAHDHEDYFLYFGRMSGEKGIITLLKAWAKVKPERKLFLVGDGPQMNLIDKFIKKHDLLDVECLGFKTKEELLAIIRKAYFVIVPSEIYENNPLSIVESYNYGKPVIGSNVGGIPEIIDNNNTGFLFEMGNADQLATIIDKVSSLTNDQYYRLSKNAQRFAEEHFSEEYHYQALMKIYEDNIHSL